MSTDFSLGVTSAALAEAVRTIWELADVRVVFPQAQCPFRSASIEPTTFLSGKTTKNSKSDQHFFVS